MIRPDVYWMDRHLEAVATMEGQTVAVMEVGIDHKTAIITKTRVGVAVVAITPSIVITVRPTQKGMDVINDAAWMMRTRMMRQPTGLV